MTETLMIFISVTTSFIFLAIGVLFGWVAAEVKQEHMYNHTTRRCSPRNVKLRWSMDQ